MARPRSEDKRVALLEAATESVAARGLGASTAQVAKLAGVAEGTLFRYFATKDELFNELYLHLQHSLCTAMMKNYQASAPLKERARAVWDGRIDWALAHPQANRTMTQLSVSEVLTPKTRATAARLFPEIEGISEVCVADSVFAERPNAFADAIFAALADVTIGFATREPKKAKAYKASGFDVLWRALTKA